MKRFSLRSIALITAVAFTAGMAGCAAGPSYYGAPGMASGSTYTPYQAQAAQSVQRGTVVNVRPVAIDASSGLPIGAVAGAVIGGILGNSIGHGTGRALGTAVGVVGGGLAGNAVQNGMSQRQGVEITVRLDHRAGTIAVTQDANGDYFQRGDRVSVISDGRTTRVSHGY